MKKHSPLAVARRTITRLNRAVLLFITSPVGGQAKAWGLGLISLMLCINGLNVINSFVLRNFMTAIQDRNRDGFITLGWAYAAVFALSTIAAVYFRFCEERLGLLWREWMTRGLSDIYLSSRVYLLRPEEGALSNPDQRITEDVRSLTTSTLSFMLMIANSTVTAVAFSGVLWNISPMLFITAVGYAICGSVLTIWLGKPLVRLNYRQADYEADFRAELVRVRQTADGIALAGYAGRCQQRLANRVELLVLNLRRIFAVNRNLGFFTTGYNYMIQLIPTLIVAPLFINQQADFGVIGQSAMAFTTLVAAFSLVITQFQSISSYAAVITRLNEFMEEANREARRDPATRVQCQDSQVLGFRDLTLRAAGENGETLLQELTVEIPLGTRTLVHGSGDAAMQGLFRAVAGLPVTGSGTILRPPEGKVAFLPENPYLPGGTLREVLVTSHSDSPPSDEVILGAIRDVGLETVISRHGGLTARRDWHDALSLKEEQQMALARVLLSGAEYVILDHPGAALGETEAVRLFKLLHGRGFTCITISDMAPHPGLHDAELELRETGDWRWRKVEAATLLSNETRAD